MKWPNSAKIMNKTHTKKKRAIPIRIHRQNDTQYVCMTQPYRDLWKSSHTNFFNASLFALWLRSQSLFVVVLSLKRSRFCNCLQLKQKKESDHRLFAFVSPVRSHMYGQTVYYDGWIYYIDRFFVGCVAVSKMKRYRLRISRNLFN